MTDAAGRVGLVPRAIDGFAVRRWVRYKKTGDDAASSGIITWSVFVDDVE